MNDFPSTQGSSEFVVAESRDAMAFVPKGGARRALLISTGVYADERIGTLPGVDPDVDLIRECLLDSHCGFKDKDVVVLKTVNQPTLKNLKKKLEAFFKSFRENDFLFLYLAGHGFHDPKTNVDYYAPSDAELIEYGQTVRFDVSTCFSFDELKKGLEACPAKFKWVVVDACRTDVSRAGVGETWNSIGKLEAAKGSLLFQSCEIGRKSYEITFHSGAAKVNHGLFTWYFCEGAKGAAANSDGLISPLGLIKYANDKMDAAYRDGQIVPSKQTAIYSCVEFNGEFVFLDFSDEAAKKFYEEARTLFEKGEYKEAQAKIENALKRVSENQDYKNLKAQIEAEIAYEEADELLAKGFCPKAREKVAKALTLQPENPKFKKLQKRCDAQQFYNDALRTYLKGIYVRAQEKIDKALNLCPEEQSFKELDAIIKDSLKAQKDEENAKKIQERLAQGLKFLAERKYNEALNEANAALRLDPKNEGALALKRQAENPSEPSRSYAKKLLWAILLILGALAWIYAFNGKRGTDLVIVDDPQPASKSKAELTDPAFSAKRRENNDVKPELKSSDVLVDLATESEGKVASSTSDEKSDKEPPKESKDESSDLEVVVQNVQKPTEDEQPQTPLVDVWIGTRAGERREIQIKGVSYGFCWIPPGRFMMGSPKNEEDRNGDETLHMVCLTRGFWALETPVTQGLWESITGNNPSYFCSTGGGSKKVAGMNTTNFPVESVSWSDCQEFIKKLNALNVAPGGKFRLPTEAEWEYACRAGTTSKYWWGDALNGDRANCDGNFPYGTNQKGKSLWRPCAVKSYAPNSWGLYDVHGNVYEWCSDGYGAYPSGEVVDPTGTESASSRVLRGGCWSDDATCSRSAKRYFNVPADRDNHFGFRLILE